MIDKTHPEMEFLEVVSVIYPLFFNTLSLDVMCSYKFFLENSCLVAWGCPMVSRSSANYLREVINSVTLSPLCSSTIAE